VLKEKEDGHTITGNLTNTHDLYKPKYRFAFCYQPIGLSEYSGPCREKISQNEPCDYNGIQKLSPFFAPAFEFQ
jgi:hypothetical protein